MKRAILLTTTPDRYSSLAKCVDSIRAHSDLPICLVAHIHPPDLVTDRLITLPRLRGCYVSRTTAIQYWDDVRQWIIMDDDHIAGEHTRWERALDLAQRRGVGMIQTARIERHGCNPVDKLVSRPVVFVGGGLALSSAATECIHTMPIREYAAEDIAWSAEVYSRGLRNYYWRGSYTHHATDQSTGRHVVDFGRLMYRGVDHDSWPIRLTEEIKDEHRRNRRALVD